jgi:hypothetical protein
VVAVIAWLALRRTDHDPRREPPPRIAIADVDTAAPRIPPATPATGAEQTVALQIQLIDRGRIDELRATFTEDIRSRVTDEVVEACRVRIHQIAVRPDWEMAEEAVDDRGRSVRRVSMFGKSVTGFHEEANGRWLADAIWCVPTGLP